ncbi:MAG: hypothetical protein ACPGXK_06185 [Phycisphaerae bacterium]
MADLEAKPSTIFVPASRVFGFTQSLLWMAAATVLGGLTFLVYSNLTLGGSGGDRLVQYSIAIIALPLPICTLMTLLHSLKWLSLGLWPRRVGIEFSSGQIAVELGLFRSTVVDIPRLSIRYPFDFDEARAAQMMEAQLPFEMQRSTLIPEMRHPDYKGRLKIDMLRFSKLEEPEFARLLEDHFLHWHPLTAAELEEEDEDDDDDRPQRRPWER